MPDKRPAGTIGCGPTLPKWLRALFAWRIVRETGVWAYSENSVTGHRQARRIAAGYQPLDQDWLNGRRLSPLPPVGGLAERRASIFPNFDVDAPMPQRVEKPRIRVPYRRELMPVSRTGYPVIDVGSGGAKGGGGSTSFGTHVSATGGAGA